MNCGTSGGQAAAPRNAADGVTVGPSGSTPRYQPQNLKAGVHKCSQPRYSQQPKSGTGPNVRQPMGGEATSRLSAHHTGIVFGHRSREAVTE